jgi:hypothetical protein
LDQNDNHCLADENWNGFARRDLLLDKNNNYFPENAPPKWNDRTAS